MVNEDLWAKWWAAQSEDHRARLRSAAGQATLDASTVQFVLETNPPIGITGSKWQLNEGDFSWSMSPSLRGFIQAQP